MPTDKSSLRYLWQSSLVTSMLYAIVCLTWGTTWLGIKIAIESVPPLTAAGTRFVIAFPFLLLILRFANAPLFFPKKQRVFFVLLTLLYFSLPYYLISFGEQFVSSGLTSLLFSTMPIFSIIFSSILLKSRILPNQVVGIVIGFSCLIMILQSEGLALTHNGLLGVFAILMAAIMHGFFYVFSKKVASDINVFTFNTLPIGVAGVLLCMTGFFVESPDYSAITPKSFWALIYLGTVASVGGFIVYFYLLKRMSPVILSFIFIIFPVVSVGIGAWYENKHVTANFFIFSILMLVGFAIAKLPFEKLEITQTIKRKLFN